jgi:hypothetical protein
VPERPVILAADRVRLVHVVVNFVTNAATFSGLAA